MKVKLFKYLIPHKSMKKEVFTVGLAMSVVLTIMAFLYDIEIIKFISSLRNEYLDYFLLSITFISNTIIIFFFLTSLFLWKEHKRRWIFPLWVTLLCSLVVSYIVKILVQRPRPFQVGLVSVLQIAFHFIRTNFNTWNFSFPSFQTVLVFSALPLLNKEFKKFRYIWLVFACLIAFSRVYFGVHYLSDVLAGGIIGYLIGLAIVKIEEKKNYGKKLMKSLRIRK
jgi:undecaprenyl-diphosphatase